MPLPTLPSYPDLGVVILTKHKLQFINSCFIPSTIRFPICQKDEVKDFISTSIKKIKNIVINLKQLANLIQKSHLTIFEEEIFNFLHYAKLHETYFSRLLALNNATRFDATDSHNFILRSSVQLQKLIDRIAVYILTHNDTEH